MSEIDALEAFGSALLAQLSPDARTALARKIASTLRQSQQKRIAAQQNPDGSTYLARKPQLRAKPGSLRRQMFAKLRTTKYLKAKAADDGATVSFTESVSRIARVHQFGLRDKVNRRTGLEVTYPERQLLGLTAADKDQIRDLATTWIAGENMR